MGTNLKKSLEEIRSDKRRAGKKGGEVTFSKYGKAHFRKIGMRGALAFHARYKLVPVNLNDFLIVNRETGAAVATLSGRPF